MINKSDSIIFLKNEEYTYKGIIESIFILRKCVSEIYNRDIISSVEGGSKRFPNATIFKYFDGYEIESNRKLFNQKWVLNCLNFVVKGFKSYESLFSLFPEQGRPEKISNQNIKKCKADICMILHLLWIKKIVLLPKQTPLPYQSGSISKKIFKDSALTPDLIRIFTDNDSEIPLKDVVGSKAYSNTKWYAYRIIRATQWYKVNDINPNEISEAINFTSSSIEYPFTLRQWLISLMSFYPSVPYSGKDISVSRMSVKVASENISGDINLKTNHGFSEDVNKKINQWIEYIEKYSKARKKNRTKSWMGFRKVLYLIVSWIINEVASKDELSVPSLSTFKRKHIDGFGDTKGLLNYIKEGVKSSTYLDRLYKIESFFEYLENFDEFDFKNRLDRKVDFPFVRRKSHTSKVIFDGEVYAPLLSFLYALNDFGWYLFEKSKYIDIWKIYNNSEKVIETEKVGFVPIFWVNGKPYPIKFISPKLAPIAFRSLKEHGSRNVPDIHCLNLFVLIAETGIRGMHARWLDCRTYRDPVDTTYKERDYGINHIHINTDKSGEGWDACVSNTVVEILDRQANFRAAMDEDCLKIESNYDNFEFSDYEKILPLFSLGGISRGGATCHSPISDATLRKNQKLMLYLFQAYYFDATKNIIMKTSYLMEDLENFNVNSALGFGNIIDKYEPNLIDVTIHSSRSQVVSSYISLLPPSLIMKITGHKTEAHCLYYLQLDRSVLDKAKNDQFNEVVSMLDDPITINAHDKNSSLRKSMRENIDFSLKDFGATSFNSYGKSSGKGGGDALNELRLKNIENVSFEKTHICPFNNNCPDDVLKDLSWNRNQKPCGGCYYSVKTVDHIPAILAKIRCYTDESNEIQSYISTAKSNGAHKLELEEYVLRRRFLTDEIIAWTITFQCLEKVATDLAKKDTWLIKKPDLLLKEIERVKVENNDFNDLYLKASEASSYAEFFTPSLEHQLTKARSKLLAHTQNFKALLDETPQRYELIDQYRGLVKTICTQLGVSLSDLSKRLEEPLSLPKSKDSPLQILSNVYGGKGSV